MTEFGLPVPDAGKGILPSSPLSIREETPRPSPTTDDIIFIEAKPMQQLISETVLFDPVEVGKKFKACLDSGKEHRELLNPNGERLEKFCYDPVHLSLLEAIAETDY